MKRSILVSAATIILLLTGCGQASSQKANSSQSSSSASSTKILAVGSTALQPLVEQAAKDYQSKTPEADITVQGGGSGAGLSQVASGSVTIGNSDIFAQEKDGIDAKKLVDHQVAVVGIAPIVHPGVGVTNLSSKQLVDIFTGKVTNWKEVGGKDQSIVLINRAQGSGTRATFENIGLKTTKVKTAQEQDSSGTVYSMVKSTPGAISYLAFSYIKEGVTALKLDDVAPTASNVTTNKWKIWAYEHMYTNGKPDMNTAKFINYIQKKSVQQGLVKRIGYIPVTDMTVSRTFDGKIEEINK
ncbi:phosphate ABC transporter substrate-binding protein PstS family protein [Lacticaseibacillus saniviri]|uniref:Phosphate-binding protein n=1 Tax=Lacticaseibacillus saniviri JCM 17471 = DSM 24301 TaxID=1293598 RepID=A0A0R2N1V4_9LACO|nr:phosphate ABC transporter substrate-binding protein PstS family protein [Lacticaseibacillus saniviri]KRO18368.1 ABC-type phosphate transport system, periplasmic component [Lacticaseibacillus saniviri JCM 17471 = DSM 24301]MCG4282180.1 phosphate ABC transporter substrate-binding protein PstS family protein [Lacticaseibacillus saniviri]